MADKIKTPQQFETREMGHSKLKQEKSTTANLNKRWESATDVRRAVMERTPIHTHIYRYEARGVRLGGCKAVRLGSGGAGTGI